MDHQIVIYTKDYCPYCKAAKALLASKGLRFTNIEISGDPAKRKDMVSRAGGRKTVPQIFVRDIHIGEYTDLADLDARGGFDALLHPAISA
ncbi:glutaredoxin 3 [Palleronia caenipelagi]|uniref:Glutaredoxin n=1 Tax=Palleronia caenipelagi TaxID=2489174 RepID=A0A547PJA3_9RHOB|nr:glutaredoxin 3 [Palleronia caenipelagi]TRD14217.1 glutaredoxin 3 [Palleronia caenipelagi]